MPVRVQPPPGARERARERAPAPLDAHARRATSGTRPCTQLVAAEAITALARELALQSQLVARDDDHWLLRVERESLNQPASRDKLQAALQALGHGVKLAIEVGTVTDSPARRNKQRGRARQRAAEEAIRNDPFVQSMMRDFGRENRAGQHASPPDPTDILPSLNDRQDQPCSTKDNWPAS